MVSFTVGSRGISRETLLPFGIYIAHHPPFQLFILAATGKGLGNEDDKLRAAKALTVAAGSTLILLGLFWPCVWMCTHSGSGGRRQNRNFTPINCTVWLLSLMYIGIASALAVEVSQNFSAMWPWDFDFRENNEWFAQVPLWTLIVMVGMMTTFVLTSCVLCVCLSLAGRMW